MRTIPVRTLVASAACFLGLLVFPKQAKADEDLASIATAMCDGGPSHSAKVASAQQAYEKADQKLKAMQARLDGAQRAADAERNKAKKAALIAQAKQLEADVNGASDELAQAKNAMQKVEADLDAFCAKRSSLAALAGKDLPRQFFAKSPIGDLCSALVDFGPIDDVHNIVPQVCSYSAEREFSFTSIGITLIQGVGDFLVGEAKDEIVQYMLEEVGKRFCDYSLTVKQLDSTKIEMKVWFKNSCDTMFPKGTGSSIDTEGFTFGALKKAFSKDLKAVPARLSELAMKWFQKQPAQEQTWIVVAGVLVDVVLKLADHEKPLQILYDLGAEADQKTKNVYCDFSQANVSQACTALLLFQLARTSAYEYTPTDRPPVAKVISDTLDAFCAVHGDPQTNKNVDGACVMDPQTYQTWHERLRRFYRAVNALLDVQEDVDHMSLDASAAEIAKRAGPELADALANLVSSFAGIVEEIPGESPADKKTITSDMNFVEACVAVYAAIVADDPVAIRDALLALLATDPLGGELSGSDKRALTAVVSLATAKDRAEVKSIMTDIADPIGTYRMKYDADHTIVTLNGYVGVPVGMEELLGGHSGMDTWRRSRFQLSAPVGVDITPWSSHWLHGGIMLTVADPLALAVTSANNAVNADWKTIVDVGAFLRIGVGRSPFSILGGVQYRPWVHSDQLCAGSYCFDGEFQVGAFIAVDVPIFTFH